MDKTAQHRTARGRESEGVQGFFFLFSFFFFLPLFSPLPLTSVLCEYEYRILLGMSISGSAPVPIATNTILLTT